MNLAIDASYSLGRELSGVGVYSRELLYGLAAHCPDQRFRWLYRPHRFAKALKQRIPGNVSSGVLWDSFGARGGLFHGLNQRLPQRRYARQVATFHDLFVLTGNYSTPEFRDRFAKQARHAAEQADRIIAVSQFTADQVHELLKVERGRIRVVPHGIVPRQYPKLPREKLVLSVGAIQVRKNTARLLEAFRGMPPDWRLVLAGSAGFGSEQILASIKDPRVTITGYVSEAELTVLYSRASIFAFPSLDEGFGMPILEAMAAGIPVITSNRGAMREVAGGAALLVDPTDTGGLSCALQQLANDPGPWEQLGYERIADFSWNRAVRETWGVYGELTSLPEPRS